MENIFKIQKYWILTICLLLCVIVVSAQVCPPIKGTIKIIPTPTNIPCTANVIASPTTQTISSGESTNIVLSSTVSGTTFKWSVSQTGVTGAIDGSGSTIAQVLTNAGTAIFTITPMLSNCLGTSINVILNVLSEITPVDPPADCVCQQLCQNSDQYSTVETYYGDCNGSILIANLAYGQCVTDCSPKPVVNCVVSGWSAWSDCVHGSQSRTRSIITPASNGGTACPVLVESKDCVIINNDIGGYQEAVGYNFDAPCQGEYGSIYQGGYWSTQRYVQAYSYNACDVGCYNESLIPASPNCFRATADLLYVSGLTPDYPLTVRSNTNQIVIGSVITPPSNYSSQIPASSSFVVFSSGLYYVVTIDAFYIVTNIGLRR